MLPQDVLQSNRELTPRERHLIKQLARDTDARLRLVKEAISTLKQEEVELIKRSENCRLALAPFRMLPRDVIGEIFLACVRGAEPSMSCKKAPVLLTHICSDFRDIALSTPTLWATIALSIPDTYHRKKDQIKLLFQWRIDAITKWIYRSGNVPLSIKFTTINFQTGWETEQLALAEVLLNSAARWCHLSLNIVNQRSLLAVRILGLTPDQVPLLNSLHTSNLLPRGIHQAPKLTELALRNIPNASQYNVNWVQLTRLILCLVDPSESHGSATTVQILRQTQKLVYLSFYNGPIDNTIDEVCLPHLRELDVQVAHNLKLDDLSVVGLIHAPALETLWAQCYNHVKMLTNLVKRSPCLHNFDVHVVHPQSLGTFLCNCPQITSLVISTYDIKIGKAGLLEELVLDQTTCTCPNLHTFHYNGILAVPVDVLIHFLVGGQGRSNTSLTRTWKRVGLNVEITDWGTKEKNDKALNEVIERWKGAGVLQLKIINADSP